MKTEAESKDLPRQTAPSTIGARFSSIKENLSERLKERQNTAVIILLFYLLPIIALTIIGIKGISPDNGWVFLSSGLLISAGGAACFNWVIHLRDAAIRHQIHNMVEAKVARIAKHAPQPASPAVEQAPSKEQEEKLQKLQERLTGKTDETEQLKNENEKLRHRLDDLLHEYNQYKKTTSDELDHQIQLYKECQETIQEQRTVINKKQNQISEFESKVYDLNYEVKTLLKLADIGSKPSKSPVEHFSISQPQPPKPVVDTSNRPSPVKTGSEASSHLKRYLDIAQKINGANHFSGGSGIRFRDLNIDNYALDLRRLFDSLGSENTAAIIVYSQKENKVLFANNQLKTLLGWHPDKFVQDFREIAQEGYREWQEGVAKLSSNQDCQMECRMKNKAGQLVSVQCRMRSIPTGIFRNHAIGILYV